MRVFIDTNILFSAILYRRVTVYAAYCKAVSIPNIGVICEKNVEELIRAFNRKIPHKIDVLNRFLAAELMSLEIAPMPNDAVDTERKIRDVKDRIIWRSAVEANVDVFLTGDKDFLESGLKRPPILSPIEYLAFPD